MPFGDPLELPVVGRDTALGLGLAGGDRGQGNSRIYEQESDRGIKNDPTKANIIFPQTIFYSKCANIN